MVHEAWDFLGFRAAASRTLPARTEMRWAGYTATRQNSRAYSGLAM